MKKKISKIDLIKSWFIWMNYSHSCYNFEKLQGLAFGHSLMTILKKLYTEDKKLNKAIERHVDFFNTEPNMGTSIHGYIISLEEKKANGENIENITTIKKGLMGTMAGMGDSITQTVVTPLMMGIAILLAFESSIIGVIICGIILSSYIIYLSYSGWIGGYFNGKEAVFNRINKTKNNKMIKLFPVIFNMLFAGIVAKLLNNYIATSYLKHNYIIIYVIGAMLCFYILLIKGFKQKYLVYSVYIISILWCILECVF